MIVYRICKEYPPSNNPIDGKGAFLYGGRWNSKGVPAVYTAQSLALARAELARHINLNTLPDNFYVYEIEISANQVENIQELPADWEVDPPTIRTQQLGDLYLKDANKLAFKVPSVCDAEQYNFIINPVANEIDCVKILRSYKFRA